MSMTDKDRKRFEEIWNKLLDIEVANDNETLSKVQRQVRLTDYDLTPFIANLRRRVANLEKLMFFSLLNDAGEQGVTPELREVMRRTGLYDLFEDALHGIHGRKKR